MQRVLKRKVNRCFDHSIVRWRRCTLLIIFFVLLVVCIQSFNFKTNLNDAMNNVKRIKFNLTSTSHVQERPELLYENRSGMMNYTVLDNEDKIENNETLFYNVQLKRLIRKLNTRETIRNCDRYGPLTNDSLIVVVQVHNRINYLRETINSLSEAHGIENVLLIFSHDYYNLEINNLIRRITFCKTIQIFYPYSLQIYTKIFPGQSPYDCPHKITKDKAIEINCINAKFPDHYGNYRNANYTQTKHHWWWKANTVFNRLQAVRSYIGLILFIEEDHYIAQDFIHVLKVMQRTCPQSKIFSLGIHSADNVFSGKPKIHVSNWIENLGISFNRSVWNEFVQCAHIFCHYDDYNWDWSLNKMTTYCPGHVFWSSNLQNSRVFHIGKCGMHFKENCTDMSHVTKLKENLKKLKLYPETIDVTIVHQNQKIGLGFGGWGDVRDHKLCMRMVNHQNVNS